MCTVWSHSQVLLHGFWNWHLPRLSFSTYFLIIFWVASDAALVVFLTSAVIVLEIMLLPGYTDLYTPKNISSNSLNKTSQVEFKFNSQTLGVLEEAQVIGSYRYSRVLNCFTNAIYSCISMACHHAVLLVTFVVLAYTCIRTGDMLASSGSSGCVLLALVLTSVFLCILIEYIECIQLG